MQDLLGNRVDHVRVGQSSRSMARGYSDSGEIEKAIAKLGREKETLAAEKRDIDRRLSDLNAKVRGQQLPPDEYRAIVAEQQRLKNRGDVVQDRLAVIKNELKPLYDVQREIGQGGATLDRIFRKLETISRDVQEIKRHLGIG